VLEIRVLRALIGHNSGLGCQGSVLRWSGNIRPACDLTQFPSGHAEFASQFDQFSRQGKLLLGLAEKVVMRNSWEASYRPPLFLPFNGHISPQAKITVALSDWHKHAPRYAKARKRGGNVRAPKCVRYSCLSLESKHPEERIKPRPRWARLLC